LEEGDVTDDARVHVRLDVALQTPGQVLDGVLHLEPWEEGRGLVRVSRLSRVSRIR
jgi:hypothetical protein